MNRISFFLTVLFLFTPCLNLMWAENEETLPEALPVFPPNSLISLSSVEQQLTKHYISQYSSTGGILWLNAALQRGNIYLPFIREEIEKRNLPPELAYLPIIESGFISTARSKSGAVGLWQFMLNSISPFGIKVNDYVDERRDFLKATAGALQKLEDNYKTLGNWELALAAYNAGLGAVSRTIQQTKIRDYWELSQKKHLKAETIHYVPKLLAVSYILYYPEQFGIESEPENFQFSAIPLNRQVSLDMLASEAGVDKDLLYRLNSELLHGISPLDRNYRLKVPLANLPQISETLEQENIKLVSYHHHTVRKGDTLYSLSRHYDVPLGVVEQHNPGISNRYLKLGEIIIFPAYREIQPPQYAKTENLRFDGTHVIIKGDTLWSLSMKYNTDPHVLAEANNMQINQILSEGKILKVPINYSKQ